MFQFRKYITLSIFELWRRLKTQNIGNSLGYQDSIFNLCDTCNEKVRQDLKLLSVWTFFIFNIASIWHQIWKDHMQIIHEKVYIILTTKIIPSQRYDKFSLMYSLINETVTFYMMTLKWWQIWSLNFMCRCVCIFQQLRKTMHLLGWMWYACLVYT